MEVHWCSVPVTYSPLLKARVSEASLMEIGTNEFVVIYSIDVSCCGRTWSVSRRFSEFVSLHTDLGRDAPPADIFSMAHVHGPVIGAVKRFSPDLIEARTRALDDFIERACDLFQYSLRLGSFLCVASSNVDSYREKRGCKEFEFEPKPCSLSAAGVPCPFTGRSARHGARKVAGWAQCWAWRAANPVGARQEGCWPWSVWSRRPAPRAGCLRR